MAKKKTTEAETSSAPAQPEVNGTPHQEVPPQSDTNGTDTNGNKPIMVFSYPVAKDTYVQASVWERVVTLKDGDSFTTHEVSCRKRY